MEHVQIAERSRIRFVLNQTTNLSQIIHITIGHFYLRTYFVCILFLHTVLHKRDDGLKVKPMIRIQI